MSTGGGSNDRPVMSVDDTIYPEDETWAEPSNTVSTLAPDAASPPQTRAAPNTFADRYEFIGLLGVGGMGRVYSAQDRISGERVAIKQMSALRAADLNAVRREVTALRWLRLPGVVQMRDDGLQGGQYFVVMDLIEGQPFPGRPGPLDWPALAPVLQALLESLVRVHRAGAVHRDLKPSNILVDAAGVPTILDFGIASGEALAPGAVRKTGTPAYAAPEQIEGHPCDARTDLYAIGVMIFEALTGENPHAATSVTEQLRRRLEEPPPTLPETFPAAVRAAVGQLLQRDPAARLPSAEAALARLGLARPAPQLPLPADRPASAEELRALFAGPDLFFHLREDAAQELYDRTHGDPDRVAAELDAWLGAGLGYRNEDGHVVLDRVAIARLQAGLRLRLPPSLPAGLPEAARALLQHLQMALPDTAPALMRQTSGLREADWQTAQAALRDHDLIWTLPDGRIGCAAVVVQGDVAVHAALAEALPPGAEGRLRHRLAARAPTAVVLQDAREVIAHHFREGDQPRTLAALDLALGLARQERDETAEIELLRIRVKVALAQESVAATDQALYELGRAHTQALVLEPMRWLLRAVRARISGEKDRTHHLLDQLAPFVDEDLEIWRQGTRAFAPYLSTEGREAFLTDLDAWANTPIRRAKLDGWLGNLRYQQGRYAEAAALHQRAAEGKHTRDARLSSLNNAANALLEVPQYGKAAMLANQIIEEARDARHPLYEMYGYSVLRMISYRSDEGLAPQEALVDAARPFGDYWEALFGFTEACIAWRAGHTSLAERLATRAILGFRNHQLAAFEAFARTLRGAIRGRLHPEDAENLEALLEQALSVPVPDIALQMVGLLALAGVSLPHHVSLRARQLAHTRPRADWSNRLDVLSFSEALRALRVESTVGVKPDQTGL